MTEILYRGFHPCKNGTEKVFIDGKWIKGEWVYGYYIRYGWTHQEKNYIVPSYASDLYAKEVIPETVGQYSGLTDKNGKKIFEGDIIKATDENGKTFIYKVVFINGVFGLVIKSDGFGCPLVLWAKECIEIIGNIYDNPELMEGE